MKFPDDTIKELSMRSKFNLQQELDFTQSSLKITNQYYEKYNRINEVIKANPKIVEAIHGDLKRAYGSRKKKKGKKEKRVVN